MIEYATRVLGVERVIDRQGDRCGWDLDFVYPGGRLERVEVKGSVGLGPFEITRNELEKARIYGKGYVLYFLAQQTTEPILLRFDDIGNRISGAEHLRPVSWAVVGWRELNPVTIPVRLPQS